MNDSAKAERQVAGPIEHCKARDRPEAIRNLSSALREAEARIEGDPDAGLRAPRPYPSAFRPGRLWLKSGRYGVSYSVAQPPAIVAVLYETADIPGRL